MKKAFITIAVATLLTGCASNDFDSIPYGCEGEESDKYCASVEDIYKKSVENDHRNYQAPTSWMRRISYVLT